MTELPKDHSARIVQQALSFERPDRLPVYDSFWGGFQDCWRARYRRPDSANILDDYWIALGVPVAVETLFPSQARELKREGPWVYSNDGWGRVVRARQGATFAETVETALRDPADLDRLTFEPSDMDSRYAAFVDEVEHHRRKGRAVFVKIGGPFIRSSFLRGEADFLMDMAADEVFARGIVERVGEHLLQIGLESLRRANAYDTGVWIYDDMCSRNAPMFSPRTFERVLMPTYERMISTLKSAGARWVILHCDGNLMPLLDLLMQAGIDGINPVEPAAGMDATALLIRYPGRLRLIGGLCNTHVLPSNDPERIRRHVEAVIDAGRDGGLIIGTHSIGPDVSLASYELYRQIVAADGNYGGSQPPDD